MQNPAPEKIYMYQIELTTENPLLVSIRDMQTDRAIYQMQQDNESNYWRIDTGSHIYKIEIVTASFMSKRVLLYKDELLVGTVIAASLYRPGRGKNYYVIDSKKESFFDFLFNNGSILLDEEAQLFRLGNGLNESDNSLIWYKGEYVGYGCIKLLQIDFKYIRYIFPMLFSSPKKNLPLSVKTYEKEISENFAILAFYSFAIVYANHEYVRRPEIIF
jgi:hypothetical protein